MTEKLGGNVAAVLKGFIERIEELELECEAVKDDISSRWSEMKHAGLPVPGLKALVSLRRKEPSKVSEARQDLMDAGALLGEVVYCGEVRDNGADPYAPAKQVEARQGVAAIERLNEDLTSHIEALKGVYVEAKAEGFAPKILKRVVNVRKDPKAYQEQSLLLETYLKAVQPIEVPSNQGDR